MGTSHIPVKSDRGLGTPGHNLVLRYLLGRLSSLGKWGGSFAMLALPPLPSFLARTQGAQGACLGRVSDLSLLGF